MGNKKKFYRSSDKVLAGVCAGLAEGFGVSASLVRLLWIIGTAGSIILPGIVIYIFLWTWMPLRPPQSGQTDLGGS
ncbi:MAG: PspC domain-containing protein [Gammaproteobacteria bacterium]|nr:PspC domain-containing protein [Gammaproteobacteria bacterium]